MYKQINDSFYLGLSSDTKPTDVWVKEGSICFETDTQNTYIFNVARNWVSKNILGGIRFIDEDGTLFGNKHVDNKIRVSSTPYLYDIIENSISGHTPWSKIGYNPSIGISEEAIWEVGGEYVWPTGEMRMEVASSSANDDMGSTGVEKVIINYLDSTFTEKSEIVEMDGLNAVPTVATDIFRVNSFRAYQVGTGGGAADNIDLRHITNTPIYSRIVKGYTRSRNVIYTVPKDKVLFITSTSVTVNGANKGVRVTTRATYDSTRPTEVLNFFMPYTEFAMPNGTVLRPLEIPTKFIEGVRINVTGVADQDGAVCSVALRGWVESV